MTSLDLRGDRRTGVSYCTFFRAFLLDCLELGVTGTSVISASKPESDRVDDVSSNRGSIGISAVVGIATGLSSGAGSQMLPATSIDDKLGSGR